MDAKDKLRKEIAEKHGIAIGPDDPILILHTVNKQLIEDSAKAQQAIIDQFRAELEALAMRWGDDAKARAERVLNVALDASRDALREAMDQAAAAGAERVERTIDTASRRLKGAAERAWQAALVAALAAVIAVLGAAAAMVVRL